MQLFKMFGEVALKGGEAVIRGLKTIDQTAQKTSQRFKEWGTRAREAGEQWVDFAENVSQGLSLPLALLGGVAAKAAADFGNGLSVINAHVQGTAGQLEALQGISNRVFKQGLGKDLTEVSGTVGLVTKSFKGLNNIQIEHLTEKLAGMKDLLGIDTATAIEQAKELMDKFGISAEQAIDLVANGITADQLIVNADELNKKLSDTERNALSAKMTTQNLNQALNESAGAALRVAQAAKENPWAKLKGHAREAMDALRPLGDALLKLADQYLPPLIRSIEQLGKWFTGLSPQTQAVIVAIGGLLVILPPIIMTIGALIMTGGAFLSFLGNMGIGLVRAGQGIAAFARWIGQLGPLIMRIGPTILQLASGIIPRLVIAFRSVIMVFNLLRVALLTNPIGIIITAIGLLIAAGILLYQNWDTVKAWLISAWEAIKSAALSVWNGLTDFFKKWGSTILVIISGPIGWIIAFIAKNWDKIKSTTLSIWNGIVSFFKQWGSTILTVISGPIGWIISFIINHWDQIKNATSNAWNAIKNATANAWNSIKDHISNMVNNIKNTISSLASQAYDWGVNLIKMFGQGIKNKIKEVVNAAKEAAAEIKKYLGFSSPTEAGPAADSDKWAPNFVDMFADGMKKRLPRIRAMAIQAAEHLRKLSQPSPEVGDGTYRPIYGRINTMPAVGPGGVVIHFHAPVSIRSDEDINKLVRKVEDVLIRKYQRKIRHF